MRAFRPFAAVLLAPLLAVAALGAGCPSAVSEVCGLPAEVPDVEEGTGTATRDGAPFEGPASWSPGSTASVTIELLSFAVAFDETGSSFDDLIGDGALPFCVPLGAQSETSGAANYVDSPGFVTDATHTGGLAVLALDGDVLRGRFEAVLVSSDGETLEFTDGAFAATRR